MISKVKAKILAKGYIDNNFNATKTIKSFEPNINNKVAQLKGHRMINSEVFKKSLKEIMTEKGLTDELITEIHERNLKQSKSIPASNEAINIYHKLEGNYAPERKISTNLNVNINDSQAVAKRIEDLKQELELLDGHTTETA